MTGTIKQHPPARDAGPIFARAGPSRGPSVRAYSAPDLKARVAASGDLGEQPVELVASRAGWRAAASSSDRPLTLGNMRETFYGQMAQLREQLATMCAMAADAMRAASRALLTADLALTEQVISADATLDQARRQCEGHAQSMLALQAPVASDLRTVLAAIYSAERIERMGDLAAHIADTARFSHPAAAIPTELHETFTEMSRIAAGMADRLGELINQPGVAGFAELDETDRTVDALHARVLAAITGPGWPHGVRPATSLALLARFHERFADQAVSVAKRLDFVTTGEI